MSSLRCVHILVAAAIILSAFFGTTPIRRVDSSLAAAVQVSAGQAQLAAAPPVSASRSAEYLFAAHSLSTKSASTSSAAPDALSDQMPGAVAAASGPMFVENVGQFDPQARFLVRGERGTLYLAENALWLTVVKKPHAPVTQTLEADQSISGLNLKFSFPGANPHPQLIPFNRQATHVSYFIGDDPAHWHADVPVWGGVRYVELYPGIDLEIINENRQLQPRLIARDNAQLSNVRLRVDGATTVALDNAPRHSYLQLATAVGDYALPLFQVAGVPANEEISAPTVMGNDIAAPFAAAPGRGAGLQSLPIQQPDATLAYTDTAGLIFSTYLGGSGADLGYDIAIDDLGAVYVTGVTASPNFVTTTGAFSTTLSGISDAFVTKLAADGSSILYSTFLGGSGYDEGRSVVVDVNGAVYVTGYTTATFPITNASPSMSTFGGGVADAFVARINENGNGLEYSAYLGGAGNDRGYGIATDTEGAAYVVGITGSTDFLTVTGSFSTALAGLTDAFVAKLLVSDVLTLSYSTYVGGKGQDGGYDIALDQEGNVYVTGDTESSDFPITTLIGLNGISDAFATKINLDGSAVEYSTYLGGNYRDHGRGIVVDDLNSAYIAGYTEEPGCGFDCLGILSEFSFPTTPGAYQVLPVDGNEAFIIKLRPAGNEFVYSSLLGGSGVDTGIGIAIDAAGCATLVGSTQSVDFPTTTLVIQSSYGGEQDGFIARFDATGSRIEYSTFIGGDGVDTSTGIAVAQNSLIHVTGYTESAGSFPIVEAVQSTHGGEQDAFIAKLMTPVIHRRSAWTQSCPLCSLYETQHNVAGPINSATGNYMYQKIDEMMPAPGGSLILQRSYIGEARDLYTRTLGYGWTHNHEIRLVFPGDPGGVTGQVQLQAPGGSQLPFFDVGNGQYQAYPGVTASMSRITATGGITTYVVTATNQTVYTFNAAGLVTQTVNPMGNVISYTYYVSGPLQSVQSYGRSLQFTYDTQNRLKQVTDPISRSTQFGYDANGDLAIVTDTRELTWTYQYSGATHLLTQIIDPDQKTVERTEYDGEGRAIKQYNGKNELVAQLQFGSGGVITVTDGLARTSIDRYGRGAWLGGSDTAQQAITRTYDANFKPSYMADPNGNGPQLKWGANGSNLEKVTDAQGFTTTMQYDGLNNLKQITDTRGTTTTYTYSGTFLTRRTDALGNTWIYTPTTDGRNLLAAEREPNGRITSYAYDSFGARTVVTVTDAAATFANVTRFAYDAVGRLITTTDPIGRITVNAYDNADHLIAVTNNYTTASTQPNYLDTWNLITRYGYDGFGRQIAVTDALGHVTRNWYDAAGRLISVTVNFTPTHPEQNYLNQYNLITRYGYDPVGNRIWTTDTLTNVVRTEYDALNRPVTVTTNYTGSGIFDPGKPAENVQRITHYDPAGNVIEQIEPPNVSGERRVTRTWYDSLNRVVSTTVNYTTTSGLDPKVYNLTTWYEYDPAGNQTAITDTLRHVTRNYYDKLGRLISTTVNYTTTGTVDPAQYNLTTRYEYDGIGNRVAITDPLTHTTRYAYDALNRLIVMTQNFTTTAGLDPNLYNLATRYRYDAIGNRVAVTDALTHTTVYTYNAVGRLLAEGVPAIGNITTYQYDALGRTIVVTDALTHRTRTYYDEAGRVVTTTNALTGSTVITYDALGRRVGVMNENGKSSTTAYDGLGRTIAITDATGRWTHYEYDAVGNRVKVIDGLGHTTVYTYDVGNRLVAQADALGNTTRYGYDGLGNRTVMTDANGIATRYDYDALNRLATVTESYTSTTGLDPNKYNLITRYGYDAVGNRTVMTNARGYTTTYTYDALSRLTALTDPLTHTTRYGYDAVGNRITMTDALTHTMVYTYDAGNRLIKMQEIGGNTTAYDYDAVGNRKTMTDVLGVTQYQYDELNRLKRVSDPYSQVVTYTYDAAGNRTNLIYPDGKVVTYTYDAANRLTNVADWSSQNTTYTYDDAGRLATTTLPNGVTTANGYDNANRLTRLTHSRNNGTLIVSDYQYTVDAMGNRTSATEITGTVIFTDGFETGNFSRWSSVVDDNGDLKVTTGAALQGQYGMEAYIDDTNPLYAQDDTPDNETHYRASFYVGYALNESGVGYHNLFVGHTGGSGKGNFDVFGVEVKVYRYPLVYDAVRAWLLTDGGGVTTTQWVSIDPSLAHIEVEWQAATAAGANNGYIRLWVNGTLQQTLSGIDNDTHRITEARLGPSSGIDATTTGSEYFDGFDSQRLSTTTINYTYDPLYRLTNANYSGAYTYTFAYSYDKVGNRTAQTRTITNTQVTNYTYDAANRLTNAGGVNYTWDNNGNLTNDGSANYLYDRANRMISTTLGGVTRQFNYNGDGVRLKQIAGSVVTTYTQDLAAPLPVVLQSKTGITTTKYVYSLGTRPLAQYTSAWEYLLPDALGSVRQIADANGSVTLAKSYEPYGTVLTSTGTASSIFAYAGEQIDTTGLIYLRARYLQPTLGMFLSRDPSIGTMTRPGSMNGWNYAEGNPTNHSDPSGNSIGDKPLCFPALVLFPDAFAGTVTAEEAVALCQQEWSRETAKLLPGGCDYNWAKAETALTLLQDYLCEKGPEVVMYYWDERLTRELAMTAQVAGIRQAFRQSGNVDFRDFDFGIPDYALAWADSALNADLSISHFIGGVKAEVVQREGRANFFIYNRTDLASGSHFAGRYESQGYRQSVEELINKDTSLKQVPLKQIWDNPQQYKVVSILQAKHRNETGGMGGGTMHQLFTWSEDATDCINDLLDFLYFQGFGDFNRHMGEYIGPYPTAVIPELWK